MENRLDLSSFKRCIVQGVNKIPVKFETILDLREKKSSLSTTCCLKGLWFDTDVKTGDIVSIQGVWSADRKMFLVSAESGLIVTSPDTLISCTRVVGSLFCARKSVLAERFQPIQSGDVKLVSDANYAVQHFLNLDNILDAHWIDRS